MTYRVEQTDCVVPNKTAKKDYKMWYKWGGVSCVLYQLCTVPWTNDNQKNGSKNNGGP